MSRWEIRHETVGRPRAGSPWRIAHVSDLHVWGGGRTLSWIDSVLAEWQPDAVAMTGDYADTAAGRRRVTEWLADVSRRWPVGWIAGNHDRWFGEKWLRELAEISGARWVEQHDLVLSSPDGSTCRVFAWGGEGPPPRAEPAGGLESRVALVHDPSGIEPAAAQGIDLILAGHLHGGQVVLGRDGRGRHLPGGWFYRWCGDRWDWEQGSLIVSRGLGDTLPVRFRCPRELVLVELW